MTTEIAATLRSRAVRTASTGSASISNPTLCKLQSLVDKRDGKLYLPKRGSTRNCWQRLDPLYWTPHADTVRLPDILLREQLQPFGRAEYCACWLFLTRNPHRVFRPGRAQTRNSLSHLNEKGTPPRIEPHTSRKEVRHHNQLGYSTATLRLR